MNDTALCRIVAERSRATADWLMHDLQVPFRDRLTHMGGHSVPRILSTQHTSGHDIIDALLAAVAADPDVELLLNAEVESLLQDHASPNTRPADGSEEITPEAMDTLQPGHLSSSASPRVIGACGHITPIATDSPPGADAAAAQPFVVHLARGLVLAAGGFGADVGFRVTQHAALGAEVMSTNSPGATAGALRAALRAGALPVQLSQIQLGPWTSPDEPGFGVAPLFCIGAGFPHGVVVDPATGKRIANELSSRCAKPATAVSAVWRIAPPSRGDTGALRAIEAKPANHALTNGRLDRSAPARPRTTHHAFLSASLTSFVQRGPVAETLELAPAI